MIILIPNLTRVFKKMLIASSEIKYLRYPVDSSSRPNIIVLFKY